MVHKKAWVFTGLFLAVIFLIPASGWAPSSSTSWAPSYLGRECGVALKGASGDAPLMGQAAGQVNDPEKLMALGLTDVRAGDEVRVKPLPDGRLSITVKRTGEETFIDPP